VKKYPDSATKRYKVLKLQAATLKAKLPHFTCEVTYMRLPTDEEWEAYVKTLLQNKGFMGLAYKLGILKKRRT